jgi:ribose transport system permease protein
MNRPRWDGPSAARQPALFALVLLVLAVVVNLVVQPNMFARETLNSNMRVFLPLILLAVGQAIVILGGGIDISVGGTVSIVNTVLATRVGLEGSPEAMWGYVFLSLLIGLMAGAINGFFIAFLRLQPIITTYATSFLYAGLALFILPNPGGGIPGTIAALYRSSTPLNLPLAFFVIAIVLLVWSYLRSTRYGNFLYAVGGRAQAAYETAVPVTWVQFGTYLISGLMAAFAGIAITMLSGSGNADIGAPMTLNSITAVVIGGNALSGGVGGVAGPVMGAITLGIIQNIISFADIDTWWETLVRATIIVLALAAPGIVKLFRNRRRIS